MEEKIAAVQRMQEFIEANLAENITLSALSNVSLFSPWYSRRLFLEYLELSPADYIRKLRLSKSALKLRDHPHKIAELAFQMGFESVDGYQRAFFREFGCNPKTFSKEPVPLYLFTPYGIKFRYVERSFSMENTKNIFIQVIPKPARKAIIKRGTKATEYFTYSEEVGCDVWGLLQSIPSIVGESVCLWLPDPYRKPGTSEYVQGVEVSEDYSGSIPDGFDLIELPTASYLMFQGEPFCEEDYCQAIEEVEASIGKYNPKLIGYTWDHKNPRIQLEPIGSRGYIELLPVKQI